MNKIDSAAADCIHTVTDNINNVNPDAIIMKEESHIIVDKPELIRDKRVLVVEDGPTLTHGEMSIGAGTVAAERLGAKELVDPRPYIVGGLTETRSEERRVGKECC